MSLENSRSLTQPKPEIFVPRPRLELKFFLLAVRYLITDPFLPKPKVKKLPITILDSEIKVWMIGHASTLINFFGTTILSDPVFSNWLPTRRLVPIGYKIKDLPRIDYILISHAHMDHLSIRSLKKLANHQTTLIMPKNCSDLVINMGYKEILEMDYEQNLNFKDLKIRAYQTQHWGERYPWQRKNRGYNCYLLEKNGKSILFGWDTGYFPGLFKRLSSERIDLAMLPIGAYYPWNNFHKIHLDPKEAIQAFIDLKASKLIPMHWGNFRLSYEPMDEPPKMLLETAVDKNISDKIHILYNSQSLTLPL